MNRRLGWIAVTGALGLALPGASESRDSTSVADLETVNEALRQWIRLMDADRPYLVYDRQAGQITLYHGAAELRRCPVFEDSSGAGTPVQGDVVGRLRRYRPAHPYSRPDPGPFGWEQVLAEEASDDSALYFSNQLLVYASDAWGDPRAPSIRINGADLRALYHAAAVETPLVLLPRGWDRKADDGR